MKAFFINSETREIATIDLPQEKPLQVCYSLIQCSIVESIYTYRDGECDGNQLVFDEEGLYQEGKCGFFFNDFFIYGNAVVWGINIENGRLADCNYELNDITSRLKWVDKGLSEFFRNRRLNSSPSVLLFP